MSTHKRDKKTQAPQIRYAQCWEDADVLLRALDVQNHHVCLSIASAGDNTLSLLSRNPQCVIAIDSNPAQIACLELRVAAYRELGHAELLQLLGSRPCRDRHLLYARCRRLLSRAAQLFWDSRHHEIALGIASAGKFERYYELFRTRVLPLVHSPVRIARLLRGGTLPQRQWFYKNRWDGFRWRLIFSIFFSRLVMSRLGRDARSFQFVEGQVAARILSRTRHALTQLDPVENPYLQWILTGRHLQALPHALRAENFNNIRNNLDRLEWHCGTLEEYLRLAPRNSIDRFNLSDVFEYMSPQDYETSLESCLLAARGGARLAYWNLLVARSCPARLAHRIKSLHEIAARLHQQDKAFFYSRFILEEVV